MTSSWSCPLCTYSNVAKVPSCVMCQTLRKPSQPRLTGELLAHSKRSQYSFGDAGKSACTIIAATAAADLLSFSSRSEGARIICEERLLGWVSNGIGIYRRMAPDLHRGLEHTALDDIWDHGALQTTVKRLERGVPIQKVSNAASFLSAIREARSWLRDSCSVKPDQNAVFSLALVITKPPETVLLVFEASCGSSLLFDSHPRMAQRGIEGSHAIRFSDDDEAASNLSVLFPSISGLGDCGYGADMMNQFEATPLRQSVYDGPESKPGNSLGATSISRGRDLYDDSGGGGGVTALEVALKQARDELAASEGRCALLANRNIALEAIVAAKEEQIEVLQGTLNESCAAAGRVRQKFRQAEVRQVYHSSFLV